MKPIKDSWCVQIELNNYCPHECAYCTRFTHHMRQDQRYNMALDELVHILETLRDKLGYAGKIGIIGGEPTIHPKFNQVCSAIKACWTSRGLWAGLWTSGGQKYNEHLPLITECFSWTAYNDKSDLRCHHQQMTMASQDVVLDDVLRAELIDNCWVQRIWCPSITPKGVFFCECAAAWDRLLDGPGGWALDSDWLSFGPAKYRQQMWCCELCGMSVPMDEQAIGERERLSETVYERMKAVKANKIDPDKDIVIADDFVDRCIYNKRVQDWAPGEYTPGRAKGGAE